jgi:hypothetical protein
VAGSYVETSPEALAESDPSFFDKFDLVIATQVRRINCVSITEIFVHTAEGGACARLGNIGLSAQLPERMRPGGACAWWAVRTAQWTAQRRTRPLAALYPVQMFEPHLLALEALCRSKGVKLLAVRSFGLMGYMRVSRAEGGSLSCATRTRRMDGGAEATAPCLAPRHQWLPMRWVHASGRRSCLNAHVKNASPALCALCNPRPAWPSIQWWSQSQTRRWVASLLERCTLFCACATISQPLHCTQCRRPAASSRREAPLASCCSN